MRSRQFSARSWVCATPATCVFLQQALSPMLRFRAPRRTKDGSSAWPRTRSRSERIQARQFRRPSCPTERAACSTYKAGSNSYATRPSHQGSTRGIAAQRGTEARRLPRVWRLVAPRAYDRRSKAGSSSAAGSTGCTLPAPRATTMALALAELLHERNLHAPVIGVDGLEPGKKAVDRARASRRRFVQPLGVGHALRVVSAT